MNDCYQWWCFVIGWLQRSYITREIIATDGGNRSSTVELAVTITNVKNQPPHWERESYNVVIPENTMRDTPIVVRMGLYHSIHFLHYIREELRLTFNFNLILVYWISVNFLNWQNWIGPNYFFGPFFNLFFLGVRHSSIMECKLCHSPTEVHTVNIQLMYTHKTSKALFWTFFWRKVPVKTKLGIQEICAGLLVCSSGVSEEGQLFIHWLRVHVYID